MMTIYMGGYTPPRFFAEKPSWSVTHMFPNDFMAHFFLKLLFVSKQTMQNPELGNIIGFCFGGGGGDSPNLP